MFNMIVLFIFRKRDSKNIFLKSIMLTDFFLPSIFNNPTSVSTYCYSVGESDCVFFVICQAYFGSPTSGSTSLFTCFSQSVSLIDFVCISH